MEAVFVGFGAVKEATASTAKDFIYFLKYIHL